MGVGYFLPDNNMSVQDKFIFDLPKGRERKEKGMSEAASRRQVVLDVARSIAVRIAKERGEVNSDDVFTELIKAGYRPTELGNASGSVFRGNNFYFTGRWKKSQRVSNHASDLRVWSIKKAEEYGI